MNKKIISILAFACLVILLFGAIPVSASESYDTYIYSSQGDVLYSPAAYSPIYPVVNGSYMQLERYKDAYIARAVRYLEGTGVANAEAEAEKAFSTTLKNPSDIATDSEGNVYVSDTDNNRVIILDYAYKFKGAIDYFSSTTTDFDRLKGPQGLFIYEDYIYVCDSGNSRIVIFNRSDYSFYKIIERPETALLGEGAYTPKACAVDKYGRVYIVASTCNEGIIVLASDNGEFTGFIGAQKVSLSVLEIFWRRFQSAEERAGSKQFVPTTFNNITVDEDGFIYGTITFTDATDLENQRKSVTSKSSAYSPVKKLNSGGKEIMNRNGFFDCGGEVAITLGSMSVDSTSTSTVGGVSSIADVAVGPEGSWSIIDNKRSRVYTYSSDGILLHAFGSKGVTLGTLKSLVAVTYHDSRLLLLDKTDNSFTVFERTSYGDLLIEALAQENQNLYDQAEVIWTEILQRNNNFDSAYIGIGKAIYRNAQTEEDYERAMEFFKAAHETRYYSDAYAQLRTKWISKYFIFLVLGVIAALVIVVKIFGKAKKFNTRVALKVGKKTYWEELMYAFHLVFHPFDGFWDIKHERRGSVRAAATFVGLTILAFYYQSIGRGYIFDPYEGGSSILIQIISILIPVILWTTANWCLTTLFDGEGSFKDVFIAVGYSLAPMPALLVVSTLLQNFMTLDEGAIATMIVAFGWIWVAFLVFFGMLVTHDYSLNKNVITTLGTIVCICVIMFVAVLFSSLIAKMVQFVSSIVTELSYRT